MSLWLRDRHSKIYVFDIAILFILSILVLTFSIVISKAVWCIDLIKCVAIGGKVIVTTGGGGYLHIKANKDMPL